MVVSRAAASRTAMTRISVGIRSRYFSAFAMEMSDMTRPRAVAMAIWAEVSVGSGAVSGVSRISSIDGSLRKSLRNATSSEVAAGPTVPSRSCASNLLAPERRAVFSLRAMPERTFDAISQERGVGHALASDVWIGSVQQLRLESQEGDDLRPHARLDRPLAPVVEIGLKLEVYEPVPQRARHGEMDTPLGGRIACCYDDPGIGQHVLSKPTIEHQLIAGGLRHLGRGGQFVKKQDAFPTRGKELGWRPLCLIGGDAG